MVARNIRLKKLVLVGLCLVAAAPGQATGAEPPVETAAIGNLDRGLRQVTLSSTTSEASFIGIRWDGDKVRGIRVELRDGHSAQAGGYDDSRYTLTSYRFAQGETLTKAWLRDSGYGHGGLRQVEFQTSKGHVKAGAEG